MKKVIKMMALLVMSVMILSVVSCNNPTNTGSGSGGTGSGEGGGNTPVTPTIIAVQRVLLDVTKVYGEKGETFQLTATVQPYNATDKTVNWSTKILQNLMIHRATLLYLYERMQKVIACQQMLSGNLPLEVACSEIVTLEQMWKLN